VGQTFAFMGAPDPRLDSKGQIDLRLKRQSRAFSKQDPPSSRVKPIPVSILQKFVSSVYQDPSAPPAAQAIADLFIIAFYFIMRPGEYCLSSDAPHPFRLTDVQLLCGYEVLDLGTASVSEFKAATFVKLTFTTQKNGNRGEHIGHGRSGHPLFCPVQAVARRVLHLRSHGAHPDTPLHTYFAAPAARPSQVTSQDITDTLRRVVAARGASYGIQPNEIDSRSLRASGAMALLCARVDDNIIRLLGRWKSDAMIRYLHVQAVPAVTGFAQEMLLRGHFSFAPLQQPPPQF
jgi:hypothetical protein